MDNFGTTICGYQISELIVFARACRAAGITENELHDFVVNFELSYKYGLECAKIQMIENINNVVKGD